MRLHRLFTLAPCALGIACYGPSAFQEESAVSRCSLYEECGFLGALGVESYEACLELLRGDAYACAQFDPSAGRACIEALDALSCEAYTGGEFPMACVDACTVAD